MNKYKYLYGNLININNNINIIYELNKNDINKRLIINKIKKIINQNIFYIEILDFLNNTDNNLFNIEITDKLYKQCIKLYGLTLNIKIISNASIYLKNLMFHINLFDNLMIQLDPNF